jgi:hypothetical protein
MKNETTFPPLTDEAAFQEAVVLWATETLEAEFGFDPTELACPEYELELCCAGELSPEEFLETFRAAVQEAAVEYLLATA